jgi:hypothetical protein
LGVELGFDPFKKIGVGIDDEYGLNRRHGWGWVGLSGGKVRGRRSVGVGI